MVNGYIVELQVKGVIKYFAPKNKAAALPHFWRSAKHLRSRLVPLSPAGYVPNGYNRLPCRAEDVHVIKVSGLDDGLKTSKAERTPLNAWLSLPDEPLKPIRVRNAIYKIRLPQGSQGPMKFFGQPKAKFGRVWQEAGHLRTFLSGNLRDLMPAGKFGQAMVLELVYDANGIIVIGQREYGAQEFYTMSPESNKRWNEFMRGSKSLDVRVQYPHYTSERSEFK